MEDDAALADGLANSLRQSGYAVDWMANGSDADAALLTQDYDLVVLDLNLPGKGGFEVLKRLRARHKPVPVLILSARDDARDRVRGLDFGADDYLGKPFDLAELEARIRALIRRSQGAAGSRVALGKLELDTNARRALLDGRLLDLTAREYGLLEILMLRAGHVVAKNMLAERLGEWGEEMSSGAIDIHIHRLRKKIEGGGVTLRTLRGFGYTLEADVA